MQLNLDQIPNAVKSAIVSTKPASKKQRTSSSGESESLISEELKAIHENLVSIKECMKDMVRKSDVQEIVNKAVAETVTQMKNEIKKEIKAEMKEEIKEEMKGEMKESIVLELKTDIEKEIAEYKNERDTRVEDANEKADGLNLDIDTLREKIVQQKGELSTMKTKVADCERYLTKALRMSNFNQQYSQKNNIKIMNWREKRNENLRSELCDVMKKRANLTVDPKDILAIHRIPGGTKGARPVIAKFISSESRNEVIKKRQAVKDTFMMYDHVTQMNADLIKDLKENEKVHSAWYYNGRVFALDNQGQRHTFDIFDNIKDKLKSSKV